MSLSHFTEDPLRTASLLVEAVERREDATGSELAALLQISTGASSVDWEPVVRELGRSLRASRDALAATEEIVTARKRDLAAAQREREGAVIGLHGELSALRTAVNAVFGASGLEKVGLDRAIPYEPLALVRLAGDVRDGLAGLSGFPALRRGMALNVRLYEAPLGHALHALANTMAGVRRAERELGEARGARDRARQEHDQRGREAAATLAKLAHRALHPPAQRA